MGGSRLSGPLRNARGAPLAPPRAPLEARKHTGHCRGDHFFPVRGLSTLRATRHPRWLLVRHRLLAFLASLVSAPFLFVLLRGAGLSRSSDRSGLAGQQAHCLRSLARGRSSGGVARAVLDAVAQRFLPAGVPDLFRVSPGPRRDPVLPPRVA